MAATTTSLRLGSRATAAVPLLRVLVLPTAVGAAAFWAAFDGGSYAMPAWTSLAIAVWWLILLVVAFDIAPSERLWTGAGLVAALLAAFAAFSLASALWGASDERAIVAFDRDVLYVGVFILVVLLSSRSTLAGWSDGLALAIAVIGIVALASRLFPSLLATRGLPEFLPAAEARLSYPLDYWNGLGIFLGMGVPLLLRTSCGNRRPSAVRAAALASVPLCVAAIYLTSSRGAVATAFVGTALLLALAQRWSVLLVTLTTGLASAVAVLVVRSRHALTDGPLSSSAAAAEGRSAAYLLLIVAVVAGLSLVVGERLLASRRGPGRAVGVAIVAGAALVAVAAVAVSHPVQRVHAFTAIPVVTTRTAVGTHLLSGSGSGRWQFWTAAVDEFRTAPLIGRGAGSFEAWWTQHASFPYFVRNAHSLYLESLGELGVVGLLLLLAAFGVGIGIGVRGLLRSRGDERLQIAGVVAAFGAYLVGAGLDWVWQLPGVTVVAIACLALAAGPAAMRPRLAKVGSEPAPARATGRGRFGLGIATLLVAWFVLAAQASLLLAADQLQRSQRLAAQQNFAGALTAAAEARQIAPWSSQPLLQLALVHEAAGNLSLAHDAIVRAIAHDPQNWRLWLIRVRVEVEQGEVAQARQSLARMRRLDPLAPLFRS